MDFEISFLRDEVRNGFCIPTAMKQCFAGQLSVLNEIDKICRKHNIQYYAEWGTLLATVRHGGYIPWDDDLDIGMKRADYNRFMEIAAVELPAHFDIHHYKTKDDYWLFITKILGVKRICFDKDYLDRNNNFPYIPCVDIFIVDNLYKDKEKEQARVKDIMKLLAVADSVVDGTFSISEIPDEIAKIEDKYGITIDRKMTPVQFGTKLYELVEMRMMEVPDDEAGDVGQIVPRILLGRAPYPRKYYDKFLDLKFENLKMSVPVAYNEALKMHYGSYLIVNKGGGAHNYPYFESQKNNLRKIADFEFPEYKFKKDYLIRKERNTSNSLKNILNILLQNIRTNHDRMQALSFEEDEVLKILAECQQFAIESGELIESVKGNGTRSVHFLEEYCEALFELSNAGKHNIETSLCKLDDLISGYEECKKTEIDNRRAVVFLTITPKWWKVFEPFYKQAKEDELTDVYVVPVPTIKKDAYNQLMVDERLSNQSDVNGAHVYKIAETSPFLADYELEGYPEDVILYDYEKVSLKLISPDVIYFQEASDNENPCYSIPHGFYSDVLQRFCEKLVYVLPLDILPFSAADYRENYNLKHYLFKPGIMNADQVYVNSDAVKESFLQGLIRFSGEEYREYWDRKLRAVDGAVRGAVKGAVIETAKCVASGTAEEEAGDKSLYYCIGVNAIFESEDILAHIKQCLSVMQTRTDKLKITVGFYPETFARWYEIDREKADAIKQLLVEYENKNNITVLYNDNEAEVLKCTAYYGAPSSYVCKFAERKKPVMIENLSI